MVLLHHGSLVKLIATSLIIGVSTTDLRNLKSAYNNTATLVTPHHLSLEYGSDLIRSVLHHC
jgi:hypothetical protein